jgi:cytochrome c oxidase cbb3-type subunit III
MPPFGRDGMLKREEISQAADYVRSLSGLQMDKGAEPAAGAKVYADNCAACHGDKGQGSQALGAPNLSDKIWLFGSDKATIVEGLMNGRGGVMPTWHGRLDDTTIKALTLYVHSLGGAQRP